MAGAIQQINRDLNRNVEIIVHVDESLDEEQRNALVDTLERDEAIKSVEFCPLRYHLMLVNYNRDMVTSQDVLGRVTSHQVRAELIGPV
jgi:hypothetical protein